MTSCHILTKRFLPVILIILLALVPCTPVKAAGNADRVSITGARDLENLARRVSNGDKCVGITFVMTGDITLTNSFKQIGTKSTPFCGIFDGGGHTLTIPVGKKALFSYVREATVKNLNIYGKYIADNGLLTNYTVDYGEDGRYATGVPHILTVSKVRILNGTTIKGSGITDGNASGLNTINISDCEIESGVRIGYDADKNRPASNAACGSFAGRFNGSIKNCSSKATVYGNNNVGGLVGMKGQAIGTCLVENSRFYGKVIATGKCVGGILGSGYNVASAPNTFAVSIKNCKVDASIKAQNNIGGILGAEPVLAQCWENGRGYITGNSFRGSIDAGSSAVKGGIIGYYRSLNKYTQIKGNTYQNSGNISSGIGYVAFLDTSYNNPGGLYSGTVVFNTGDGTKGCPAIEGCTFKDNHNRNDDPLGRDKAKLCKAQN